MTYRYFTLGPHHDGSGRYQTGLVEASTMDDAAFEVANMVADRRTAGDLILDWWVVFEDLKRPAKEAA